MKKLIYTDSKGRNIIGVPARDLSHDEIKVLAYSAGLSEQAFTDLLVQRGLYALAKVEKPPKKKVSDLEDTQELEDGI